MKFPRRTFLHLAAGAAALPAVPRIARAQAYPSRPVRIVVGFPAGGATDIQARLMGQWLSDRLGQQFIVENRAGASGNIGTEAVAKAPADGYTLLQVVTPHAINAALYSNLNFDFIRDIAPVICAARLAYVVVVHPSVPATTIPEFIAYAKANPGKINYGSAGPGTPQNIACELFKMMAGVNLVHVPYRGGAPATTDLVGGHIQVIFSPVSESIEHIKAGKLRALAVTTATRLDVLPDVPTVADFVPGYEASGFAGIGAPRDTPADIIDMLNKELNAGLADIHHHVIAFHRHRQGLGDVRPLHHGRARLDIDRVSAGAKAFGVAVRLAGADVEFPAVPGAAEDFAEPGVFDLAGIGGLREPDQRPFAQGRALMRAAVQQAEELAVDVEHRDRALVDGEEFARARRQLVHRGDDVTA